MKAFTKEWWRIQGRWAIILRNVAYKNNNLEKCYRYEKLSDWIIKRVNND